MSHADNIAPALGRIPSGLFIITLANSKGEATGYLGSFLMQVGFNPPQIVMALSPDRYAFKLLKDATHLGIHILEKSQTAFLKHFGRGFGPGEDAFKGLSMLESSQKVPLIADIETRLIVKKGDVIEVPGDHALILGEVIEADFPTAQTVEPWIHLRKNGLNY